MFSQAEEDDILAALVGRLGIDRGRFVEIGVGWGGENNTRALATRGWFGHWFGDEPLRIPVPDSVTFTQVTVTLDNVLALLVGIQPPIDVFSLDIDGNDFWIGQIAIEWLRPRIIIVEYYAPRHDVWVMPYTPGYRWHTGQPCGASLAAWQFWLADDYDLVYTTTAQVNAFFVRRQIADNRGGTVNDTIKEQLEEALAQLTDLRARVLSNENRPSAEEIASALAHIGANVSTALQNHLLPPIDPALAGNVVDQPLQPPSAEPVPQPSDAQILEDATGSDDEPAVMGAGIGTEGAELPPPPDSTLDP